ncbi:fatty acyl-CoA hydrolase precursor, medium chain-like isoform X4 [Bacillus rossius redtenbacheri]
MSEFVTVDIPQGRLRGKRVTSDATGVSYYSFQGIPYAKPPVGPLRFKPPEDPEPWTGTRDALAEGPICVQGDMFSGELVGDEDCLFLNVYTPQLATRSPKPVMVWIHGGKFSMGSGNTNLFGPDFLVAEEVVLVTINYRLGALGFLYLEGCDVTGNNGLRDQVMALKWVRDNIAQFGGDPGNVTIFGESAGGASVHYLTLSPLASGLFHRAIAQSGSVFIGGCNVPVGAANQRARRLARALGCRSEDPRQVAACLRSVPAEQLVADKAKARDNQELHGAILDQFFPSHETGPEAFLPDSPRRLLESGLFSKVPFITGVTSAEGKVKLFDSSYRLKFPEIDQNFTSVLPMELSDNLDVETCNEIANVVKKFYFGEKHLCEDTVAEFIEMQSDVEFVFAAHETLQLHARWSQLPVFAYLFDHEPAPGSGFLHTVVEDVPGVPHAGELPFLFRGSEYRDFPPGAPDAATRGSMVKLWTQFAKTGNPSSDAVQVTWIPATKEKLSYLKINGGFKMETDMFKRRTQFWEKLYEKYLPRKN